VLRRSRLRLVALLAAVALFGGCKLGSSDANSDQETAPYGAILDGRDLLRADKLTDAEAHFLALTQKHPRSLDAARGLQDARKDSLASEDFLSLYRKGAEAEPTSSSAWYLQGRALLASQQSDEARASFEKALELDPTNAWAVSGLAYLAAEVGDLFEAVQIYERAIAAAPRSAQLRWFLGDKYLELGLFIDAQRQLEIAHRLAPENLEVSASLGKVWLALGQEQEAFDILKEAREKEPRIAHLYPSLAALYLRRGDPEAADEAYRRGLEYRLAPDPELASEIRTALVLRSIAGEGR